MKILKKYNRKKFYNSYIWKKIRDKKFQDNLFDKIEVEKIRKILEKFYIFKEKIDYKKDVPLEYIGIHIRRGDKVFGKMKEAEKIEVETYLSYIPENMKTLPLFVATDDEEVIEELRKLYGKDKIYTLFSKNVIRKNEKDFEKQSKEFIKKHTLLLLKEVEILTNSKCFIGSYTSNIGRFIALRRNFINSYSVDVDWAERY